MSNDHSDAENTPTDDAATFDPLAALEAELAEEPADQPPDSPEPHDRDVKYDVPVHLDDATQRAVDRALASVRKSFSVPRLPLALPPNVFTKFDVATSSLTVPTGHTNLTPRMPPVLTGPAVNFTVPAFTAVTADIRHRISGILPTPSQLLGLPSIEAMVPSIGLAQQSRITHAINSVSFADVAGRIPKLILPAFDQLHGVQTMLQGLGDTISTLLASWGSLSDLGHRLARMGLQAARDARAAVVAGDLEAVEEFAGFWLGLKKITKTVIQAVSAALLDPGWDTEQPEAVLPYIKSSAKREKKNHKLLGETRAGRSQILPLDRELNLGGEVTTSFAEILPGPDVHLRAVYETPLALDFLEHFTEVEVEIIETYVQGGTTWPSAAIECGQAGDFGEKVRRKFAYRKKKMASAIDQTRRRTA